MKTLRAPDQLHAQRSGPEETGAVLPFPDKLSRVDVVIVKDSWNKFLAFDEMLIEIFFERLLLDAPELVEQFGRRSTRRRPSFSR